MPTLDRQRFDRQVESALTNIKEGTLMPAAKKKARVKRVTTAEQLLDRVMHPNKGRPVINRYKVQQKQWAKWSNHARKVFNAMMDAMRPSNQWKFLHPKTKALPREQWGTVQWNAAWEAACAADGSSHAEVVSRGK